MKLKYMALKVSNKSNIDWLVKTHTHAQNGKRRETMESGELKVTKAIMITNTLYDICHVRKEEPN